MTETVAYNPLTAYARWISGAPDDWPEDARDVARRALVDVIACMLPGSREPVTEKVCGLASQWSTGPCGIVGHEARLSPLHAALVNGTSAHALDFDDNFDPAKAHATAVLVPALLAICDLEDLTVHELIDGYIAGLQILGCVGQAVNPFHRSRGWHATATLGAIGAAAASARALKLAEAETAHAISLSTSRAAGYMSQFGTDTKPLHAGFAASGGVEAALMARAGITAGSDTLHGPNGLRQLMVGPDADVLAASMAGKAEHGQTVTFRDEDVGDPLHILQYGLKVKRFPNCGSVHRALDGLLDLREAHGFDAAAVDHILVRAPAAHLRNLMYETPETPAEARFSLEYNLAVGLLEGDVGLIDFERTRIARRKVRALFAKIRKDPVEALESEFPTEVHVTLKSGATLSTRITMPVGSRERPLTDAQVWQKFDACAKAAQGFSRAADVRRALERDPARVAVRELTGLLAVTEQCVNPVTAGGHVMTKLTALVLAASRKGPDDPVARLQGISHKCLIEIDGEVMLERVVREIRGSRHVGRIFVSIESEDILRRSPALAARLDSGDIAFVPSGENLFLSVADAAQKIASPYPLLISTGDNALHTSAMIDHFAEAFLASEDDAKVAMTPADVILAAYPDGRRAFHELKDGGWSSCNLYGLRNDRALLAARAFETGGQFGKNPQRIATAFGLPFMVKYRFRLATLEQLGEHLSRRWKLRISPVIMPFADAPIDVDNPGDFERSERILKSRRAAA